MSLGLQATKRRISSVSSTKKITKAMELVATAKLKTWKDKLTENSIYTSTMIELANEVFSRIDRSCDCKYLVSNKSTSDLYIVITSNLGLCAGYNYDVFKTIDKNIKEDDQIIMIGLKGYTHYSKIYPHMNVDYIDASARIDYNQIEKMCNYVLEEFSKGKYAHIKLIYTRYVNSLTFVPDMITLLPTERKEGKKHTKEIIMEPSPEEILDTLIPLYIKSVVYGKLIEAQVAEQASRRTAMETATDNSQELIDKLQIEFNKARQAAITQEITEVVGGSINK